MHIKNDLEKTGSPNQQKIIVKEFCMSREVETQVFPTMSLFFSSLKKIFFHNHSTKRALYFRMKSRRNAGT